MDKSLSGLGPLLGPVYGIVNMNEYTESNVLTLTANSSFYILQVQGGWTKGGFCDCVCVLVAHQCWSNTDSTLASFSKASLQNLQAPPGGVELGGGGGG